MLANKTLMEAISNHTKWPYNKENLSKECEGERLQLVNADLRRADLHGLKLCYADLRYTNLRLANLLRTDLRGADVRGADFDFSVLPLWCGGLNMKVDNKLQYQILYHAYKQINPDQSPELKELFESDLFQKCIKKFHRFDECEGHPNI